MTSPLPAFLITAALLMVARLVTVHSAFYGELCQARSGGRYEAIDGLRGFLALGVFFYHAVISYYFYVTGRWVPPPSSFYALLGSAAVSTFFMITGFLFWAKVIKASGKLNLKNLYVSRVRRLVPLYVFSVLVVFAVVAVKSGFELRVGWSRLLSQLLPWFSFSLFELPDINGVKHTEVINAGVTWTLAYEWKFYAFLPVLALFAKGWKFGGLVAAGLVCIYLYPSQSIIGNFLFGMLAAAILEKYKLREWFVGRASTLILVVALLALFATSRFNWSLLQSILLFVAFLFVAHGNGIFGLLTSPASKYLGHLSYSIYLLHGIVLSVALSLGNGMISIRELTPYSYWTGIAVIGSVIVLLSGLTYRFIEHPFLTTMKRAGQVPSNRFH